MQNQAHSAPYIIELKNISKSYVIRNWKSLLKRPPQISAIKDISLQVKQGEIMGLLGPNGAGKTTLLKILATLITPDSGSALISGIDCNSASLAVRKKIGFVNTNDRSFYWRLSGFENLQFFGHLYDLSGNKLKERIENVLSLTGLEPKQHQRFGTYSSGERQRLAIARAMLSDPEILLMDEATANLDPIVSAELITFTKEQLSIKEQKTIVWCTHNLTEAETLCDRVAIVYKGSIISCNSIKELKEQVTQQRSYRIVTDTLSPTLAQQNGYCKHPHPTHHVCTVSIEEEQIPQLLKELTNESVKIYECAGTEQSFESIFIELIQKNDAVNGEKTKP